MMKNNPVENSKKGFTLVEAMVALALFGGIGFAFMSHVKMSSQSIATTEESYKILEMQKRIEQYFARRSTCKSFFEASFSWNLINSSGISKKVANPVDKTKLESIFSDRRLQITKLETRPLRLSPSPLSPLPSGGIYKAAVLIDIFAGPKALKSKTTRAEEYQLFSGPLKFIFNINKDQTLHDCYVSTSKIVLAQENLCNNMGGILEGDRCYFPQYSGTIDQVNDTPTNSGIVKKEISELLCDLDKRAVLIQNKGVPAILDPDNPSLILVNEISPKTSVTKYCEAPVGRSITLPIKSSL